MAYPRRYSVIAYFEFLDYWIICAKTTERITLVVRITRYMALRPSACLCTLVAVVSLSLHKFEIAITASRTVQVTVLEPLEIQLPEIYRER